ncbi:MAG: anthranilate phosphoribosyltransferase [Acidobacteria bacterium]|nr:anthranilate phosphoribosyltransferase [Acidobacteriota bacterium]
MASNRSDWLKYAPASATSARAETPLFPYVNRLMRGQDLDEDAAEKFFSALTEPEVGSIQIAAALTALTAKGETAEELAGMARVVRRMATKVSAPKTAFDISGTGSSPARTFAVSTAAALVAAGAGLVIAKQSNRGLMTKAGSADVLGELGVKLAHEPADVHATLSGTGLSFLSAPKFHLGLRRIADVRGWLGIRTSLNLPGLMANPAGVTHQLIGVWHRSLVAPVAHALCLLGAKNAWVVHGSDGLDEVTLAGKTFVGAVKDGEVRPYTISPADFGIKPAKLDGLKAATAKESANIIRDVLASKRRDEARSLVILNAASALFVGGIANDPVQAARLAERSIDSGMAQNKLERLVQFTNKK